MSLMLPEGGEGLVNALLVLTAGDIFPKADEDMLRNLAISTRGFGNHLLTAVDGLDSLVADVVQGLETSAGRQFAKYGYQLDKYGAALSSNANQIGELLDDFALGAENAKYQMVIGATITASMIAWGLASPWGMALVSSYVSALRSFMVDVFGKYLSRLSNLFSHIPKIPNNTLTTMIVGAGTEGIQELSTAFLSQFIQWQEGNRKTWDTEDLALATGFGAGAGFVAPFISSVLSATPSAWHRNWDEVRHHITGTNTAHLPPPSITNTLTNATLTEAITELVISAATLPLGGALTGLGYSTVSGFFSGFTETAADLTGQHLYNKHQTPKPPPANTNPSNASGDPNDPNGGGSDNRDLISDDPFSVTPPGTSIPDDIDPDDLGITDPFESDVTPSGSPGTNTPERSDPGDPNTPAGNGSLELGNSGSEPGSTPDDPSGSPLAPPLNDPADPAGNLPVDVDSNPALAVPGGYDTIPDQPSPPPSEDDDANGPGWSENNDPNDESFLNLGDSSDDEFDRAINPPYEGTFGERTDPDDESSTTDGAPSLITSSPPVATANLANEAPTPPGSAIASSHTTGNPTPPGSQQGDADARTHTPDPDQQKILVSEIPADITPPGSDIASSHGAIDPDLPEIAPPPTTTSLNDVSRARIEDWLEQVDEARSTDSDVDSDSDYAADIDFDSSGEFHDPPPRPPNPIPPSSASIIVDDPDDEPASDHSVNPGRSRWPDTESSDEPSSVSSISSSEPDLSAIGDPSPPGTTDFEPSSMFSEFFSSNGNSPPAPAADDSAQRSPRRSDMDSESPSPSVLGPGSESIQSFDDIPAEFSLDDSLDLPTESVATNSPAATPEEGPNAPDPSDDGSSSDSSDESDHDPRRRAHSIMTVDSSADSEVASTPDVAPSIMTVSSEATGSIPMLRTPTPDGNGTMSVDASHDSISNWDTSIAPSSVASLSPTDEDDDPTESVDTHSPPTRPSRDANAPDPSGDGSSSDSSSDSDDSDSDSSDSGENSDEEDQEDDEEVLENPPNTPNTTDEEAPSNPPNTPNTSLGDDVSERHPEGESIETRYNTARREFLEAIQRLNRSLDDDAAIDDEEEADVEPLRMSPEYQAIYDRFETATNALHESIRRANRRRENRGAAVEAGEVENLVEEGRPDSPIILPPIGDKKDGDARDSAEDQWRGRETVRGIWGRRDGGLPTFFRPRSEARRDAEQPDFRRMGDRDSDHEPFGGGEPEGILVELGREGEQEEEHEQGLEPGTPAWRIQQQRAEAARRAERERALQRPPEPPRRDPAPEHGLQLPPEAAIVSIGVPKGRLPGTQGLIQTITHTFRQLRDKPAGFWTNFERELLAKHRQISFDARRRRVGAPPPVSHPFQIDDITLFISLALNYRYLLDDASAARDGIPREPGRRRDKRGRVEGVDTVNGAYDLGPTIRTMSGPTTYTALNFNPSFAFPQETWRPGLSLGLEADINRSQRTITDLTDAETGRVEDARVATEYLVYQPHWVVRILNPAGRFTDIFAPNTENPLPDAGEVLVLGIARPYLQQVQGIPPARVEEVHDDNRPAPIQHVPAITDLDTSLRVPKRDKLIKNRPAEGPNQRPPAQVPNRRLPPLPDHYFASGLTGIDKLYQHALSLLTRNNIADFDNASIITKLWTLEANLHNATRGGYRFPVFNNNAQMIALFQVDTTLFPGGFGGGEVMLAHDELDNNAPRFGVDFPPTQLIGSVSDLAHIEDVATAIDGLSGTHVLSQSMAGNAGFSASVKNPGNSDVGMSAALNTQLKTGNTNGVSTSRNSLWVHVARFVGRTGAYSIPMTHRITLLDPGSQNNPARVVPSAAMVRVPESEAARRRWPLEPNSPFQEDRIRPRGAHGNIKDFSTGVGMGLVRLDDDTVDRIRRFLIPHLAREGFLHDNATGLQTPTLRNDGVRRHKQLENRITLDKLVSHAALRANFDMAHQDGYTFTLDVPTEDVLPHVPSVPGVPGRLKSAKITILATPSRDHNDNRSFQEPTFRQTTRDFHTVNLAMGMTTVGQSFGGSVNVKAGGKFNLFKDLLRNFGVLGGGYTYTRGANNEAKLFNNRPELLEYAHEVEEWTAYSDWTVQIEYQDAPILTRTLPPPRPLDQTHTIHHQEATVHTLDFVNGREKNIAPLNPDANLERRHRHFLDNFVVYKMDTTGMRPQLLNMMRAFAGPAGYADQELSTLAGTTTMRAFFKEMLRDGISTELPFIPGWFKDKHGSAIIAADMLGVQFDGATRESFTLGIIKLGLVGTSMSHNENHAWASDMFDFNVGKPVNVADLSGGVGSEHKQTWGTSKNAAREGAFERIQLRFGPAYKYRLRVRFRVETSTEYGGKLIKRNLIATVTRQERPQAQAIPPAMLEAAQAQGIPIGIDAPPRPPRPDLPPRTHDGARVGQPGQPALPGQPAPGVRDAPEPGREDRYFDIERDVEILVPERDALLGFVEDALPVTTPQLNDVMTRFVDTEDGNAPPISGTLAAKVLLRWDQLAPRPEINNYARVVLERHRNDDPRYLVSREVLPELARLVPNAAPPVARNLPFQIPAYLNRVPQQNRIIGHSGITAVRYQRFDENDRFVTHSSIYDTIVDVVGRIDPRALSYDVITLNNGERHTRSKLKPIQGVSEGLASVLGRGRDDMFIDDLLHDQGLTFALVHPTNWTNSEILEITVQMRLKDDYEWGDVAPKAGTENFTHGYTGQSSTVSKSDSLGITGKFTAARAPNTHVGLGGGRVSVNNGYSRSLTTGTTVVSEQTVFDWGGFAELDVSHETIITVRRFYMNERWLNNLSLTAFNRGSVILRHEEHLFGKISLEVPLSIAMGNRPLNLPPPRSNSRYVGKLPGDATVAGNTLDGLVPAAQRMLNRIERKFWTISNFRNLVTGFMGMTPFETNPSALMQALLTRTQLNGHIPAALGGGVHRLAENMIIPGRPDYVIDVDMFGELLRVETDDTRRNNPRDSRAPEVLLESTGSGSGRYNKFLSSINHNLDIDYMKGALAPELGYNFNRNGPRPLDGSEPRVDQVVGGGIDSSRTTSTGTAAAENRNRRDEQHIKPLVNKEADPDGAAGEIVGLAADPNADFESMYSVRFTGRFRLTAKVRNRNIPDFWNPWTETFRTNWVEGDVYVTLTKSQYIAMMNTNYATPNHFLQEALAVSGDNTHPEFRARDNRFAAPAFLPRGFDHPAAWRPIAMPVYGPQIPPLPQGQGVLPQRPLGSGPNWSPGEGIPVYVPLPGAQQPPGMQPGFGPPNVGPDQFQYFGSPPFGTPDSGTPDRLSTPSFSSGQLEPFGLRDDPPSPPARPSRPAPGQQRPGASRPLPQPQASTSQTPQHQAPQRDQYHLNQMRMFFNTHDRPSRQAQQAKTHEWQEWEATRDRLTAALNRYDDAGITNHFANLPNRRVANAALGELMRQTLDLIDPHIVRAALQRYDRNTMIGRFNLDSGPEAATNFVADVMRDLRTRLGFNRQTAAELRTSHRPLPPIPEADEFGGDLQPPWGQAPALPRDPELDEIDLLRPPPGSRQDRHRTPQDEQRERVLDVVRRARQLRRDALANVHRYWQLAHAGVADALDNVDNRDLGDQVMVGMIRHENENLARAFFLIAPDQMQRIFANDSRWTARDFIWVLEEIHLRPYPDYQQQDIWGWVESIFQHRRGQ